MSYFILSINAKLKFLHNLSLWINNQDLPTTTTRLKLINNCAVSDDHLWIYWIKSWYTQAYQCYIKQILAHELIKHSWPPKEATLSPETHKRQSPQDWLLQHTPTCHQIIMRYTGKEPPTLCPKGSAMLDLSAWHDPLQNCLMSRLWPRECSVLWQLWALNNSVSWSYLTTREVTLLPTGILWPP